MTKVKKPWIVRWDSASGAHCGRRFANRKAADAFEVLLWHRKVDGSTFYDPKNNQVETHGNKTN